MYGIQKYGKILNVPETPEKSAKKHYHRLLNTIFFYIHYSSKHSLKI